MQRKKIYIILGLLVAVVAGCGISDSKVSNYQRKGTSVHQNQNSDTVNLSASIPPQKSRQFSIFSNSITKPPSVKHYV